MEPMGLTLFSPPSRQLVVEVAGVDPPVLVGKEKMAEAAAAETLRVTKQEVLEIHRLPALRKATMVEPDGTEALMPVVAGAGLAMSEVMQRPPPVAMGARAWSRAFPACPCFTLAAAVVHQKMRILAKGAAASVAQAAASTITLPRRMALRTRVAEAAEQGRTASATKAVPAS
jgi:hypothetical protein